MKNIMQFVLLFAALVIMFSCGDRKQDTDSDEQESNTILTEELEQNNQTESYSNGSKTNDENETTQDFSSMSCDEFATAYKRYVEGYAELMNKYKDVDKNDFQAALAANNDMLKLAKDQEKWMSASTDFLQKCKEDEEFKQNMNAAQKKLNELGN